MSISVLIVNNTPCPLLVQFPGVSAIVPPRGKESINISPSTTNVFIESGCAQCVGSGYNFPITLLPGFNSYELIINANGACPTTQTTSFVPVHGLGGVIPVARFGISLISAPMRVSMKGRC